MYLVYLVGRDYINNQQGHTVRWYAPATIGKGSGFSVLPLLEWQYLSQRTVFVSILVYFQALTRQDLLAFPPLDQFLEDDKIPPQIPNRPSRLPPRA